MKIELKLIPCPHTTYIVKIFIYQLVSKRNTICSLLSSKAMQWFIGIFSAKEDVSCHETDHVTYNMIPQNSKILYIWKKEYEMVVKLLLT